MASYSASKSKTATLVAATVDTVTLSGGYRRVQVVNHDSSSRISCKLNGTAVATADEDGSVPVPPGATATLFDVADGFASVDEDAVVTLVSAGTPTYTVVLF